MELPEQWLKTARDNNLKWQMLRILSRHRNGLKAWLERAGALIRRLGFEQSEAMPCFFYARARRLLTDLHMDDFHGTLSGNQIIWFLGSLKGVLMAQHSGLLTVGCSYAHARGHRERLVGGTIIRADGKHTDNVLRLL